MRFEIFGGSIQSVSILPVGAEPAGRPTGVANKLYSTVYTQSQTCQPPTSVSTGMRCGRCSHTDGRRAIRAVTEERLIRVPCGGQSAQPIYEALGVKRPGAGGTLANNLGNSLFESQVCTVVIMGIKNI